MDQKVNASLPKHQNALLSLLKEFDRVCHQLDIPYILFAGTMLGAVRHEGFIPWDDDLDVLMFRDDYERFLREAESVLDQNRYFLQKEFSEHWPMFFSKLRLNGTTCLEKFHPRDPQMHQGIYMDIFPCDNALQTELGRKVQFWASKVVIAKSLMHRGYETDSKKKRVFMSLCRMLPQKLFLKLARCGKGDSQLVHSFFAAASSYEKNIFPRKLLANTMFASFADGKYRVAKDYDQLLTQLYGDWRTLPPEEDRRCKQHAILIDLYNSYEYYADYRDGMQFDVHTRSIR